MVKGLLRFALARISECVELKGLFNGYRITGQKTRLGLMVFIVQSQKHWRPRNDRPFLPTANEKDFDMRNRIKAAYARAVLFIIQPALEEHDRAIEARGAVKWKKVADEQRTLRTAIEAKAANAKFAALARIPTDA
jgi:hypothetical protein